MNPLKSLKDHFLRIDARSLGLFRLAMGVVLVADLLRRFRYAKELYSNEGVLPNHAHLFNLRETTHVWSVLHAFSSPGEAQVALLFILFFYACFLVGWHTRAFQVVALASLVSLGSRNVLLENAGNYLAVALLAFTVFLPLGSRFSVDSLRASMDARDEKGARSLNDRRLPNPAAVEAARDPGWTPTSVAALAVLVQIALVYACMALQQKGDLWGNGTALYYAMSYERWTNAAGVAARSAPPALLSIWTRAFRLSELGIPVLVLIPAGYRYGRMAAVALTLFTGLTLGIFFSLGLFGWTLVAAAALLVPVDTWDRLEGTPAAKRARTVIYDVDCGMCLWLSRVLKRLDLRHHLTFQGNDDLDGLNVRGKKGEIERAALPAEVTADRVASSVVVVGPGGKVHTRAHAVAEVVRALPLGWTVAWLMKLPGVVHLLGALYDFVAARRQRISVAMGKAACGVEKPVDEEEDHTPVRTVAAPAVRLVRGVTGGVREVLALVVLAAAVSQATQVNDVGWKKLVQPKWLEAVVIWPRMLEKWDVLASPPTEDEAFAVDAQTKGGKNLDTFTGKEPDLNPGHMRGTGLGQLWNDYLWHVHQKEWSEFQRAFRDYLNKGGPRWPYPEGDDAIAGYDAYWLKQPIPPPGEPRADSLTARDKFMTQARGGKLASDRILPVIRPDLNKPR
jgi:predicted DCC family thiol-disulfide oxidoreductase YuxK